MNVKNENELRNVEYNYNKYSNVCQVYFRRMGIKFQDLHIPP